MSQRERHAAGIANPQSADPGIGLCVTRTAEHAMTPCWEDGCLAMAPDQRDALIRCAHRQGYLLADQISKPAAVPRPDAFRELLLSILAGNPDSQLQPLPLLEPLQLHDSALDARQADAVNRALNTPDLFILQGAPGTGKSRVITEIIQQCLRRGERILFLAARGATVDGVLERLATDPTLPILRVMDRQEYSDSLPDGIVPLTFAAREQTVREQFLHEARSSVDRGRAEVERFQALCSSVDSLEKICQRETELAERLRQLDQQVADIPNQVALSAAQLPANPAPDSWEHRLQTVTAAHSERMASSNAALVDAQKARAKAESEIAERRKEVAQLQVLAAQKPRPWWCFWQAKPDPTAPERLKQAENLLTEVDQMCHEATTHEQQCLDRCRQAETEFQSARSTILQSEVSRRTEEIEVRRIAMKSEYDTVAEQLRTLRATFATAGVAPAVVHDCNALRNQLGSQFAEAQTNLKEAEDRRKLVEAELDGWLKSARTAFSVVAGPISALSADVWFGDPVARNLIFDCLIVDEAHAISEAAITQASRRATRWIFIGEPPLPPVATPTRGRNSRSTIAAGPATSVFHRLARQLQPETWFHEGKKLGCRLRTVSPLERQHFDKESVADQPDIELRILTRPKEEPVLAEVVFPARYSPVQAKEYLYRELGEIPIQVCSRTVTWSETADRFQARFEPSNTLEAVTLQDGITEWCNGPTTVGFDFDRQLWDWPQAQSWLADHLLTRDGGRIAWMTTSHRHTENLAAWLSEGIYDGDGYRLPKDVLIGDAIHFEPVPRSPEALDAREHTNGSHGDRRAIRGGAGLEIDLATGKQRCRLPSEYESVLPDAGLVNLDEARTFCECLPRFLGTGSIIVTAPYAAQVQLLRHAAGRHATNVKFLALEEVTDQEADILIVSLTRSHVTRAVTYGDDPMQLLRAFTRARKQMVFLGDVGTLARRARWEGGVDHLDEVAGERERAWVQALLRRIPSRFLHPVPARVPESVKA